MVCPPPAACTCRRSARARRPRRPTASSFPPPAVRVQDPSSDRDPGRESSPPSTPQNQRGSASSAACEGGEGGLPRRAPPTRASPPPRAPRWLRRRTPGKAWELGTSLHQEISGSWELDPLSARRRDAATREQRNLAGLTRRHGPQDAQRGRFRRAHGLRAQEDEGHQRRARCGAGCRRAGGAAPSAAPRRRQNQPNTTSLRHHVAGKLPLGVAALLAANYALTEPMDDSGSPSSSCAARCRRLRPTRPEASSARARRRRRPRRGGRVVAAPTGARGGGGGPPAFELMLVSRARTRRRRSAGGAAAASGELRSLARRCGCAPSSPSSRWRTAVPPPPKPKIRRLWARSTSSCSRRR